MNFLKVIFIVYVFSLMSCQNKLKFDKLLWTTKEYPEAPPQMRNNMVYDLTTNYKLRETSYKNLVELLGEPDGKDSANLFYDIIVDYGSDIDPVYIKTLSFEMDKDSIIKSYKITEWHK